MDPFLIKQNDRLPGLEATLTDDASELTTLAGATVDFVMKDVKTGSIVIRGAAVVVNGPLRIVRYDWAAGDTAVAGQYRGEFEVMIGGKPWTFPNPGYIPITINPDLG